MAKNISLIVKMLAITTITEKGRKLLFLLLTKLPANQFNLQKERMDLNQILGQGEFRTPARKSSIVSN